MSKKSFAALMLFNIVAITTQVYSVWVIRNYALENLKKEYMSFGADLNALTVAALSVFESDSWKCLYLIPTMCAILLFTAFFTKMKSGLLVTVSFITIGVLLLMWFALLEPMLR